MACTPYPVALTIAGSDSGGGAGVQADLRAFGDCGVHGCSAITALTAQNPHGVRAIQGVTPNFLRAQLEAVAADFALRAVKTGMLFSAALIQVVSDFRAACPEVPWVIDPVMIATSGAALLEPEAIALMAGRLAPQATLLTPNIPEAHALLARCTGAAPAPCAQTPEALEALAQSLAEALGVAVLLKGGHASAAPSVDFLARPGRPLQRFCVAPIPHPLTAHGTGCALSAAIAANLARGRTLEEAIARAKDYVAGLLAHAALAGRAAVYTRPNAAP